jgi:hypothetical protein
MLPKVAASFKSLGSGWANSGQGYAVCRADSYKLSRCFLVAASAGRFYALPTTTSLERVMGKYVIAWILGVPAVVLIGIYAVSHLL